jgi:hypothetical protein
MTADAIYAQLAGENDLYGKAFFGWSGTPEEIAKLEALWDQARDEATTGVHA